MSENTTNKFEQMLEKLTNDDRTGAEELFHEIVVEKSRSIYENLLESDLAEIAVEETAVEEAKKDKEEIKKADKEDSKEEMKKESTEEVAAETIAPVAIAPVTAEVGGDATDNMIADIEAEKDSEDKGEEKPADADIENKIVDLEDAVEELKAEFEKLMSDEAGEEHAKDGEGDKEAEKEAEAVEVQPNAEEVAPVATSVLDAQPTKTVAKLSAAEQMREYVDKVAVKHADATDNAKSPVAKQAKAQNGAKAVDMVGSEEKSKAAPKAELNDAGNVNIPGGDASKLTKVKDNGNADKTDNKKSTIGSK